MPYCQAFPPSSAKPFAEDVQPTANSKRKSPGGKGKSQSSSSSQKQTRRESSRETPGKRRKQAEAAAAAAELAAEAAHERQYVFKRAPAKGAFVSATSSESGERVYLTVETSDVAALRTRKHMSTMRGSSLRLLDASVPSMLAEIEQWEVDKLVKYVTLCYSFGESRDVL
jgi:hypothetical protein